MRRKSVNFCRIRLSSHIFSDRSVIDLQSESYRWLGSLRFDIKGVVEIFSCESYKGKITYLEAEKSEISGSASSATSGGKSDETAHDVHDKSLDLQHVHDLSQNVEQWKTLVSFSRFCEPFFQCTF